jgi:hypothetical protein
MKFILSQKYLSKIGKNIMNTRIFKLLIENLHNSFNLEKYAEIRSNLTKTTAIESLPWTPARFEKFKGKVRKELGFDVPTSGSIAEIVDSLDVKYLSRYFGEIWKPTTEVYTYSGWALVDEVNKHNPKAVLDVGCGYNQFKGRINNLVGIDPYNNCADYMVDVLDFVMPDKTYDHILVLGALNFNEKADLEIRLAKIVELLADGGKIYFRANPGNIWNNGPYVDIFPWDFALVTEFAKQFNLNLETFKKDNNDRLYFVYSKTL